MVHKPHESNEHGGVAEDALARLMAGQFMDPDGDGVLPVPATVVVLDDSLDGREAELVEALSLGPRLIVVSDPTTRQVLGRRVERALAGVGRIEPLVLEERPAPDAHTVARLEAAAAAADGLLAVGSGTITDLCKLASARARKPFAVFATAPSMNGYTSPNAAISIAGHKTSIPAQPAAAVFLDLEVLAAAPVRLIRAGLGDAMCRSTAQADWLLAHLLLGRPYRTAPFALLAADEGPLLEAAQDLVQGDRDAIRRLARTLILSGFGMAICGGSEPASQGEHLISHYAEMMAERAWPATLHGEQVAVATLTMARLQQRILKGPPPELRPSAVDERALIEHFGPALGRSCWAEFRKKRLDPGAAIHLNARLERAWDEMRERIRRISRPAAELEEVLRVAGAPLFPDDLGWPSSFYRAAVRHARLIRNRYTFLDLAADSGVLDGFGPI